MPGFRVFTFFKSGQRHISGNHASTELTSSDKSSEDSFYYGWTLIITEIRMDNHVWSALTLLVRTERKQYFPILLLVIVI